MLKTAEDGVTSEIFLPAAGCGMCHVYIPDNLLTPDHERMGFNLKNKEVGQLSICSTGPSEVRLGNWFLVAYLLFNKYVKHHF